MSRPHYLPAPSSPVPCSDSAAAITSWWSLRLPSTLLPQELCSCYSLCLECSSLMVSWPAPSLPSDNFVQMPSAQWFFPCPPPPTKLNPLIQHTLFSFLVLFFSMAPITVWYIAYFTSIFFIVFLHTAWKGKPCPLGRKELLEALLTIVLPALRTVPV